MREGGDWFARSGQWRLGVLVWCAGVVCVMPVWERDVAEVRRMEMKTD